MTRKFIEFHRHKTSVCGNYNIDKNNSYEINYVYLSIDEFLNFGLSGFDDTKNIETVITENYFFHLCSLVVRSFIA